MGKQYNKIEKRRRRDRRHKRKKLEATEAALRAGRVRPRTATRTVAARPR